MTDIDTTERQYHKCCFSEGITPHPYVQKMFKRERQQSYLKQKLPMHGEIRHPFGEDNLTMCLYLGGNNHILTSQRLSDADTKVLCICLVSNTFITKLDLRYNNLTDIGAKALADLLKENVSLTELNLMFNDFGEDGAKHLAKALEENKTLLALRLTGCKIGDKGGMAFAQALQINSSLEALDLGETDMKTSSLVAVFTVLHQNRSLKAINVNRPIIFSVQEELAVHAAQMLKVNSTLEELSMEKYEIRDFGLTQICDHLKLNFSLTYLNLANNRITQDGAKELGQLLRLNTGLKVIDLANNRIQDEGAVELAIAIATYNTTITTLVVTSNTIRSKGLCSLADALRYNGSLTNIYIWGNIIEEPTCDAFSQLLETGRLEEKNVDIRPYVVDGVTYLAQLSHGIRIHYYWAPSYGDDVPEWHPRCNPRYHPRDPGIPLE